MSIFKETFQPHIFRQLKIRESIMGSTFDGAKGRLGTNKVQILKPGALTTEKEDITLDPGAFYTLNTERQCVIKMSSGVDLRDDCELSGTKIANPIYEGAPWEDPDEMEPSTLAERYVLYGGTMEIKGAGKHPGMRKSYEQSLKESYQGQRKKYEEEVLGIEYGRKQRGHTSTGNIGNTGGSYGDPTLRSDAQEGFGIVPMPGIKDMTIRTTSAYGSLRVAKVSFHCHNRRQLEVLELLYMRPGYPILIEWGWTPFIDNEGKRITKFHSIPERGKNGFFNTTDPPTIKDLNEKIFQSRKKSGGNYDGFLGFCKNFEFKVREDGGYDCFTEIIAAGEVLESLKGRRGDSKGRLRYATTWEEFLTKSTGYNRFMSSFDPEAVKFQLNANQYKDLGFEAPVDGAGLGTSLYWLVALRPVWKGKNITIPDIETAIYDAGNSYEEVFNNEDYRAKALTAGWVRPVDNLELYLTAMADTQRKKIIYSETGKLGLRGNEGNYGNKSEKELKSIKSDSWLNDKDYIDLYLIAKKLTSGWAPKGDKFDKENRSQVIDFLTQGLMHDMEYFDEDVHDYVGDDDISGSPSGEAHGEQLYKSRMSKEMIVSNGNYSDNNLTFISQPTRDRQGTAYQKIPAAFVRWDFLCEIINNLCIPKYRSKSTTNYIDEKWDGTDELGITELSYTRDNIDGRNGEEYISYSRFYIPDTNLSQINVDFKDLGKQIDKSIDPSVCFFPNQADIGRLNIARGVPSYKIKSADLNNDKYEDIYNGIFPLKGKNKKNKLNSIGYIYLNIKHLRDVYKDMRYNGDDTLANDFSLLKYLKRIWEDVSTACGNTHNFILQTEYENPNIVRVIDTQFDGDGLTDNLYEFDILGKNSIVRDFNYHSTIPSALSSTIAIAAQAGGDIDDLDKVSFAAFNENVKSRFTKIVENTDDAKEIYDEQRRTLAENIVSLKNFFKQIELGEGWYDINMNNEQPLIHTDSAHRMINQILKAVTIINAKHPTTGKLLPGMSIPMPKSSIIPIKFSAVLDGIGGFVIGNVFKVKKDKLPKAYQNKKIAFAILNESQKVTNGQDWTTTIGGSIILQDTGLKRDDDGKIPNYIPIHNPIDDELIEEFGGVLECPIADYMREYLYWLQASGTEPGNMDKNPLYKAEYEGLSKQQLKQPMRYSGWTSWGVHPGRHLSLANNVDGKIDPGRLAIYESGNRKMTEMGPYAGRITTTRFAKWAHDKGRSKSSEPYFTRDMTPRLAEVMLAMFTAICKEVFGFWEKEGTQPGIEWGEIYQSQAEFSGVRGRRVSAVQIKISSVGRANKTDSQHTKGKAFDFVFKNKSKGTPHEMTDKDMYIKIVQVIRGFTGATKDIYFCNEYEDASYLTNDIRGKHRGDADHFHVALDGGCKTNDAYGEDKSVTEDEVARDDLQGWYVQDGYLGLGGSSQLNWFQLNDLLYKDTDWYGTNPDGTLIRIGTGTMGDWPMAPGTDQPSIYIGGVYRPDPTGEDGFSITGGQLYGPIYDEMNTNDPSIGADLEKCYNEWGDEIYCD